MQARGAADAEMEGSGGLAGKAATSRSRNLRVLALGTTLVYHAEVARCGGLTTDELAISWPRTQAGDGV